MIISAYSKRKIDQVIDCIGSIQKQSVAPREILLVLDPDPEVVGYYKENVFADVRIIESDGFGLSKARNTGVRNSESEIVAFIDDDAVAGENWLKNLIKNYSDPSVVGVGGPVMPLWNSKKPDWFPEELNWVVGCTDQVALNHKMKVRNPVGCNMSFRKSVVEEAGCFRPDIGRFGKFLLSAEESELCLRIKEGTISDARIINDPSAIVFHKISEDRVNVKYVLLRSFFEGVSKSLITKTVFDRSMDLTSERNYMRNITPAFVASTLKEIYKGSNIAKLALFSISTLAVLSGYGLGKIFLRK